MRGHAFSRDDSGPFVSSDFRSGDPYEVSFGHRVPCAPTGGSGSGPYALGASVVGWDPAVTEVGVDAGHSPEPRRLRAPDVAVGNVPNKPGWIQGFPQLAIEYADVGQDEPALQKKIDDRLEAGGRHPEKPSRPAAKRPGRLRGPSSPVFRPFSRSDGLPAPPRGRNRPK